MNSDYCKYENQAKDLAQEVISNLGLNPTKVKVGFNNRILGASSYEHQIDISMEYFVNGNKILRIFECKLKGTEKVSIEEALIFYSRIVDIQNKLKDELKVEGNFITTIGYTEPARIFSNYYGIETNYMDYDQGTWVITNDGNAAMRPPTAHQSITSKPPTITFLPNDELSK